MAQNSVPEFVLSSGSVSAVSEKLGYGTKEMEELDQLSES